MKVSIFCKSFIVLFIPAIICSASSTGDDPQAVFLHSKTLYQNAQYDSTIKMLKAYINKHGKDTANEYLVPLLMESIIHRGDDTDFFEKLFDIYIKKYPASAFIPRLYYLNGISNARQNKCAGAIFSFSTALTGGVAPALDSAISMNVRSLCEKNCSAEELTSLKERKDLHPRIIEICFYGLAANLFLNGQSAQAERVAHEFEAAYPKSAFLPAIKNIFSKSRSQQKGQIPVGVLAPLSGSDADLGKKIVSGIQCAVTRFNQAANTKINLIVADTRGNMVETAKKTLELVNQNRTSLILGPVLSQNAVVTASMLIGKDVVMLSPTATEDGIADLGPNIFQMNVTLGTLGRKIADYAMQNLTIKDFAIMSPNSDYGRALTEVFKEEVIKNGGEIVDEEYFDEEASDFKPQFLNLRQILFARKIQQEEAAEIAEPKKSKKVQKQKADSLCLADSALGIGGLFIPAETEAAVMIAPQVPFYKIHTQMLGATGWYSPKTLLDGKQYVNNAIIVAAFENDRESGQWQEFAALYKTQFGAEADRVAGLGYDAGALLCKALEGSGNDVSIKKVIKNLQSVQNYKGVSGMITFEPGRGANKEAAIYKILDKKFIRVE